MRLSIITINYNNCKGLEKTLESISNQSTKDFEWCVIDGGSTDGSVEVLRKNESLITYWKSEPDSGIYDAMNKGIKAANGDFLLFLNSGDYLCESDVISKFYAYPGDEDIIYGDIMYETESGLRRIKSMSKQNLTICDFWIHTLPHQASFIKRTAFDKYGYYNEKVSVSADWLFYIKSIIIGGASYKHLDLAVAAMQPDGLSSKRTYSSEIVYLEELIPKRILCDIPKAVSLAEIQEVPFCGFIYKVLYRLASILKSMRHHSLNE
ncbi:MAG: glycosyltransferase [Bacteroidaceae bacterium]|nr:glycosyltransferase [Bacteroidaceae bacterium]